VQVNLLGPIELSDGLSTFRLPGAKLRTIVALLALAPRRVVSCEQLIDELWIRHPPGKARNAVQAHIVRLRRILSDRLGDKRAKDMLQTSPAGYVLHLDDGAIDAHRFSHGVAAAKELKATDQQRAAELLRAALALWRGPALLDVGDGIRCRVTAVRLEELRLVAQEEYIDAEIKLGHHDVVTPELEELVACYPLRERFCEQLMVALYRAGRQTDALDVYQRLRRRLGAELGLEPGPPVSARLREILNHDPMLLRAATVGSAT
jgi:DNA-binding SARP family transcriptional activator